MSRASWMVLGVVAVLLGLVAFGTVTTDARRIYRVTNEAGGAAC